METLTFGTTEIILHWNTDLTFADVESNLYTGSVQKCNGGMYAVYLRRGHYSIGRASSIDLKDGFLFAMRQANKYKKLSDQMRFI